MITITYHGKKYPLFTVKVDGNWKYAAYESLATELFPNDEYADVEGEYVDNIIYFYVDDNVTNDEEAQVFVDKYCS